MYLLKNAKVYDAEIDYAALDILVDGSKIVQVAESIEAPAGCEVLDMTGCTVLPCFVDAHVHAGMRAKGVFVDNILRKLARRGVSLCKDDGILASVPLEPYLEFLGTCKTPRHARVVTAGRYIDVEGGYGMGPGAHMGGPKGPGGGPGGPGAPGGPKPEGDQPEMPGMPEMDMDSVMGTGWGIKIETAEEAADAVTYQFKAGTDGVKIGISDHGAELTDEMIQAITDRAKSHGMWTTAHVGSSRALQKLVDNGIGEGAHTPADRMSDELIAQMVRGGISMITTVGELKTEVGPMDHMMNPGVPDEELKQRWIDRRNVMLDNLKRFYDAGGVIAIGTDLMNSDAKARIPVDELEALRSTGIPMHEVVRCGTANAVKVCALDDEGYVKAGMLANLIAIQGELDEKFTKLDPPVFVMNQGSILRDER